MDTRGLNRTGTLSRKVDYFLLSCRNPLMVSIFLSPSVPGVLPLTKLKWWEREFKPGAYGWQGE